MKVMRPTKQRINKKAVFGFDIETANNNTEFVMASIVGKNYEEVFYTQQDFISKIKTDERFRNCYMIATNLEFDLMGVFFTKEERKYIKTLFRGSRILVASTYFYNNQFHTSPYTNTKSKKSLPKLTFLDTFNYAHLSVKKLGEIIGLSKLETPSFIGQHPQTEKEWDILREYNLRDSRITYEFMEFFIKGIEKLGGTFKNTMASIAMSLFRTIDQKQEYFQQSTEDMIKQLETYYGGRTEAFVRGVVENVNYYDVNSEYPFVMKEYEYPDPNTLRVNKKNTTYYIENYEGCALVDIQLPYQDYPLIPHRKENGRVLFPYGRIRGRYTNIELRQALQEGAIIHAVYENHWYKKTCRPFVTYVERLYALRSTYKKEGSNMQLLVKLLLNSLYGKFGQKFLNKDNWTHENTVTLKQLQNATSVDRKGDYIRLTHDSQPAIFCIPIWASYISAYGRIHITKLARKYNALYMDTDSIITKDTIEESNELGGLKLEMSIKQAIIVRPKFYAILCDDKEEVKIKGLALRLSYLQFVGLVNSPLTWDGKTQPMYYEKFATFKEALRRDFIPNEIIQVHKQFSLEDEKRHWVGEFDPNTKAISSPIEIRNTNH